MDSRWGTLGIGVLALLVACGGSDSVSPTQPAPPPTPPPAPPPVAQTVLGAEERCADHPGLSIASFEDDRLEASIRSELGVGSNVGLTCDAVGALRTLNADSVEIESLVGIQNLTGLTWLNVQNNSIADVGSLAGLPHLANLFLAGNSISDVSALGGLLTLRTLSASENDIADISPLGQLTGLTGLFLQLNSISDVGPVSSLTSLTRLNFGTNQVTDVGALTGLINLSELVLQFNAGLTDISPLLANAGIGTGDDVYLLGTNPDCADVIALRARGATVHALC